MNRNVTVERLFKYYIDNQDKLVKKYSDKYLVITDNGVVATFTEESEAYYYAVKEFGLGSFILQKCSKGRNDYTLQFNSPSVSF